MYIKIYNLILDGELTLANCKIKKKDLQDKDTMYNSKKYVLKSVEMEEADASGVYAK